MLRFPLVMLALVMLALVGCVPDGPCTPDTWRCDGSLLQVCTPHPGGVYGMPPTYVRSSDPTWDTAADCGAGRCIAATGGGARAFCALDPARDPACTADGYACDATTLVTCRDGYALERQHCRTCDASHATCAGALFASCSTSSDCADGMTCDATHACVQSCACADGSACAACDAADAESADPDNGAPVPLVCRAGACTFATAGS